MENLKARPTRDELIALLPTPNWELESGNMIFSAKNRMLEELVRTAHARHKKGEAPGLIKRTEDALEIEAVQLQELWAHLGLPL